MSMERFIQILNWCKEHPLERGYEYEISSYIFKRLIETCTGIPVSQDEIACCYKILGYNVKKTHNDRYTGGDGWKISAL